MGKETGIGVIGAGKFGDFLIRAYSEMDGVKVTAIADAKQQNARRMAEKFGIKEFYSDFEELIMSYSVDVVVLPVPPFLHKDIVKSALHYGKSVVCEKPLALSTEEGEEIWQVLKDSPGKFTINYVMRKNQIVRSLKKMISEKYLGRLQSFHFRNFAQTSGLGEEHWFWEKSKSGGIWIEHGVHFFDMFRYLLSSAPAEIKSLSLERKHGIEDEVACVARYNNEVLGTYFHSFSMPSILEETRFELTFDWGIVKVEGWIPRQLEINAIVSKSELEAIWDLFPSTDFKVLDQQETETEGELIGRNDTKYNGRLIRVSMVNRKTKEELYRKAVQEIMNDAIKGVGGDKVPEVGFEAAFGSLEDAVRAETTKEEWLIT